MRLFRIHARLHHAALAGQFGVYLAIATASIAFGADGDEFAPLVRIRHDDYAHARQNFHTKLLREGPSPQPSSPAAVPEGVLEVEYASGKLQLKAWLSKPSDDSISILPFCSCMAALVSVQRIGKPASLIAMPATSS